jgi:hypothetical protein
MGIITRSGAKKKRPGFKGQGELSGLCEPAQGMTLD